MTGLSRTLLSITAILICSLATANRPDDSKDTPPVVLDEYQVQNLYLTGKIWGFLKYHHPAVTGGCLDWDKELLERLPGLRDQLTQEALLEELDAWVVALDEIDIDVECAEPDSDIAAAQSRDWVSDPAFVGDTLGRRLDELATMPVSVGGQHYVSLGAGVGNPVFQNESAYIGVEDIDWRYRLLALYRFWNIVEYWSPYRNLIEHDFEEVLRHHISRFYSASDSESYVLALLTLTASVQDSHTSLWSATKDRPPAGAAIAPYFLRFVEGMPIVWRALEHQMETAGRSETQCEGLRIGDVILSIDGKPVTELIERWAPYYGASNRPALYREIGRNILRGEEGTVTLEIDRNGEQLSACSHRIPADEVNLRPMYSHDREGSTYQSVGEGILYLKPSTISAKEVADFNELVQKTDALIVDLRGYPSTFVVFSIGQHLVSENTSFARFTVADLTKPGSFEWGEPVSIPFKEPTFSGRVVILVDETTQSQAEYTAMAFRASPRAVVIGSQTAGADGNASPIALPGGHLTMISGVGVYYPDKRPTQKIGIVADIEVRPTIDGIRSGQDEVLQAAIEYIRSN